VEFSRYSATSPFLFQDGEKQEQDVQLSVSQPESKGGDIGTGFGFVRIDVSSFVLMQRQQL
jgi:hypothetical protein